MTECGMTFPEPYPTAETARYWQGAADGRMLLMSCDVCSHVFLYPRMVCPKCWGEQLTWCPAAGSGWLVASTVVHRPGHQAFADLVPYICAVVRLDEGPTLMTNLTGATPAGAAADSAVTISFVDRGGWMLPVAELTADVRDTKES